MSKFPNKLRKYRPFFKKTRVILKLILLVFEIVRRFLDLIQWLRLTNTYVTRSGTSLKARPRKGFKNLDSDFPKEA